MTFIYYILLCFFHILALPFLCILACKQKYRTSIPLRFLFPKIRAKEYYDIWLHACSVGEVQSLQTLIKSIPQTQSILLSVITQTGYMQAQKLYAEYQNLTIGYLPFETFIPLCAPTCKRLFVFEAELWLMVFVWAKRKGATTKLINARISTRSANRYQKLAIFYRHLFSFIDYVLSQSDEDTKRLCLLGAKNVQTLGNIKLLNPIKPKISYKKPKSLIVVAASTHTNEEMLILEAWHMANITAMQSKELSLHSTKTPLENLQYNDGQYRHNVYSPYKQDVYMQDSLSQGDTNIIQESCKAQSYDTINKDSKKALLVVVPRHPERFNAVYELCKQYGKTLRLSAMQDIDTLDFDSLQADILLIDTMGMLINFYAISDIVILGGAFAKVGGHNPLEPANFYNVVISGTEIFNQKALFSYVQNYYLVNDKDSLSTLLHNYKKLAIASINKDLCMDMIERILA